MVIGILDSGMGGLAVAKKIKSPQDQLIVVLDRGYFPYGNKSKLFLLERSYYLVEYLLNQGAELIILACNTLSVTVTGFLRSCFQVPILSVFEYFSPYLKKENIFMGSYNTIRYVKEHYPIECIDGTELIAAIEEGTPVVEILGKLDFKQKKNLLLGCTHFLTLDKEVFPLRTMDQIEDLKKDIKKARENLSL